MKIKEILKTVIITDCSQCDACIRWDECSLFCGSTDDHVPMDFSIPETCPLEDYIEVQPATVISSPDPERLRAFNEWKKTDEIATYDLWLKSMSPLLSKSIGGAKDK